MTGRSDDFSSDSSIDVVNPDDDTSGEALTSWIAELEREGGWIDLPTSAAELIVLDASAGAEIVVRTVLGRSLLALAPRDRMLTGDRVAGVPNVPVRVLHISVSG